SYNVCHAKLWPFRRSSMCFLMRSPDTAWRTNRQYVRSQLYAAIWLVFFLGLSCHGPKPVPIPEPGTMDATPPLLRMGSAGLRKDILLTQDSTDPDNRRARSGAKLLLLA